MNVSALMAVYARTHFAATKIEHKAPPHTIRILVLQPALSFDDLIDCSLQECELSADANYTALSYSWATQEGDASATRVIQLDDELHPVTENLYLALLRLRSTDHARRLWVDAVCIDQNDEQDKNRQVALMGQIYSLAHTVVAWLGEGESEREDEAAYAALQCILADKVVAPVWSPSRDQLRLKHTWLPHPLTNMKVEQCTKCIAWDTAHPTCSERYGNISPQIPELRRALLMLLRRRYFKRRWVIQEITVPSADAVTFMWNHYALSRTDFVSGQYGLNIHIPNEAFQVRRVLVGVQTNSLLHVVERAYIAACSEPRDRVYALLSLAQDHGIRADYTRSVADTYTEFAGLFIRENRMQDLLRCCSGARAASDDPITGLPSWVPDLREQLTLAPKVGTVVEGVWAQDSILHIPLHRLGVLRQPIYSEDDLHIPVYDDVTTSGALLGSLGNVKIYHQASRRMPEEDDVLCTLELPAPYMVGEEIRAAASGFILRRVTSETWRIVNRFEFRYIHHDYRPYRTERFSLV